MHSNAITNLRLIISKLELSQQKYWCFCCTLKLALILSLLKSFNAKEEAKTIRRTIYLLLQHSFEYYVFQIAKKLQRNFQNQYIFKVWVQYIYLSTAGLYITDYNFYIHFTISQIIANTHQKLRMIMQMILYSFAQYYSFAMFTSYFQNSNRHL